MTQRARARAAIFFTVARPELSLLYHNGHAEGVKTRAKRIMRRMHGRAGFDLHCHRIVTP
jgi:transposase